MVPFSLDNKEQETGNIAHEIATDDVNNNFNNFIFFDFIANTSHLKYILEL